MLDDPLDLAILDINVRKAQEIREEYGFAPPFFGGGETIRALLRKYGRRRQLSLFEDGVPVPLVLLGLGRYLVLLYRRGEGEEPESTLLSNPILLVTVALWAIACAALLVR